MELSSGQLKELVAFYGVSLKGGTVLKAEKYIDPTGEVRFKALIDYGIAGTKKFDASEEELDRKAGRIEPGLENLTDDELRALMVDLGVSVGGRFNKVKAIVAIRDHLRRDVEAEMKAEASDDGGDEEADEPEDVKPSEYAGMTKGELLVEAESKGVKVYKSWKNEKIIEALLAS